MSRSNEFSANIDLASLVDHRKLAPHRRAITQNHQLDRALYIRRSIGMRAAAGYMWRMQWSLEAALLLLCGTQACERARDRRISECF